MFITGLNDGHIHVTTYIPNLSNSMSYTIA